MSLSSASRTAPGLPGKAMTSIGPTEPAAARDSIAAGPISWKERLRKISPKPSSRLDQSGSSASSVQSFGASSVPPV